MPVRHSAYSVKFSSIMQWQREFIIHIDTTVLYTRDRCHPIKLTIRYTVIDLPGVIGSYGRKRFAKCIAVMNTAKAPATIKIVVVIVIISMLSINAKI